MVICHSYGNVYQRVTDFYVFLFPLFFCGFSAKERWMQIHQWRIKVWARTTVDLTWWTRQKLEIFVNKMKGKLTRKDISEKPIFPEHHRHLSNTWVLSNQHGGFSGDAMFLWHHVTPYSIALVCLNMGYTTGNLNWENEGLPVDVEVITGWWFGTWILWLSIYWEE